MELRVARDALWGEIELARRIQTALLPINNTLEGYGISASMVPATEVGGDYYDILTTKNNERWIAIGDVSGHGVDSGLIMMMVQTSIFTVLNSASNLKPSGVIDDANVILRENILRLKAQKYMTISVLNLREDHFIFAGKHQDILIYRAKTKQVEEIGSRGTWLGIIDNISKFLNDIRVQINTDDIILLFTDGVTEAVNKDGEMFGQARLIDAFKKYAAFTEDEIVQFIIEDVCEFQEKQFDDITAIVIRKK